MQASKKYGHFSFSIMNHNFVSSNKPSHRIKTRYERNEAFLAVFVDENFVTLV